MKQSLFPLYATSNYKRSVPLNKAQVWLAPERWGTDLVDADYLTGDIYFPEWHVKAGIGGAWGGYCQGVPFSSDKVKIVPKKIGETTRNVLQMSGNYDGRGIGVCTRQFEPVILWAKDIELEWTVRVMFSSEHNFPIYFNTEIRGGLPTFKAHKNESSEVIGVHFMDKQIMLKWWLDPYDDITTDKQHFEYVKHELKRDVWYRVTINLVGSAEPHTWLTHITILCEGKHIYELHTDETNSPNGFAALGMAMFGIERGGLPNGIVYVAKSAAYLVTPEPIEEK